MPKPYNRYSQEQKEAYIQRCTLRRWERKQKLVDLKGGKCEACGYSKCLRALSFHHRNPAIKGFPLDIRNLASRNWNSLVEEVDKCDLLCIRCHMELEDGLDTKYIRFQ